MHHLTTAFGTNLPPERKAAILKAGRDAEQGIGITAVTTTKEEMHAHLDPLKAQTK